jgi:AraC family transcriptional regulator, regulatory protein of adaptative response / methylated-DNA-[protein]-cysteine methyltransferase
MLTQDNMFKAFIARDASYEGAFFTAVKTTGIFCRPTCTARKPKRENVEFFESSKDAIAHGYRPCKLCSPLERIGETPAYIAEILRELNDSPSLKFKDYGLRSRGIDPATIRRWFKKHHGITFHSYQRMIRINTAFKKIKEGATVTTAAFESGYESLSGFNDSFKSAVGVAPSESKQRHVITIARIDSPLGPMLVGAVDEGICLLEFTDRRMLETQLKVVGKRFGAPLIQGTHVHIDALTRELNDYFAGKRREFTVPLVSPGTAFQQKVWEELCRIPYGTTRSYKQQAEAIGMPDAVRAVANANGMNRISIVIPCHRVIGSDGQLTGYGGGLWRKKWLLDLESGASAGELSYSI